MRAGDPYLGLELSQAHGIQRGGQRVGAGRQPAQAGVGPVLADRRELRVQRRVHPGDGDPGGIGGRAQPGGGLDGQGVRQVRRQDDPQPRPSQARGLPGLADPVIDRGQHVPGGVQQHGARRGQPHPVPAAVQQRRADELFQPPDLLAEGRLGDEQPLRGAGEGARLGDRDEIPQVPQLKTLWRLCVRPGKPDRFRLCLLHVRHLCQAVVCLFFHACIVPGAGPRSNLPIAQSSPGPGAVTAPRGSPRFGASGRSGGVGQGLSFVL